MRKSPPSKPSPVKASPKKTKSPPKKAKEQQTLTFGQPYEIKFFRVYGFYLWHARNPDDKNDAFMKNMIDEIRNNVHCELRAKFDIKGDVTRRQSLSIDEPMKNQRKSYERKFILQVIDEEEAVNEPEAHAEKTYQTALAIQKVKLVSKYAFANKFYEPNALLLFLVLNDGESLQQWIRSW